MAEGEVGAGGFVGVESWHEAVDPVGIEGLFGTHVKPGDTQAVGVVAVVAAAEFVVFNIEGEEAVVCPFRMCSGTRSTSGSFGFSMVTSGVSRITPSLGVKSCFHRLRSSARAVIASNIMTR